MATDRDDWRGLFGEAEARLLDGGTASRLRFSDFDHLAVMSIPRYKPLLDTFRPVLFRKHALIHPRLEGPHAFMVKTGRVRVFLASEDDEYTLGYLERGGFITTEFNIQLDAAESSEVMVAPLPDIQPFLRRFPELMQLSLRNTLALMNMCFGMIESLAFHDVRWRLAGFLVHAADAYGRKAEGGVEVPLRLSTEKIAHLLGTRRQRISTALNELVHVGILERTKGGGLLIKRMDALRAESAA